MEAALAPSMANPVMVVDLLKPCDCCTLVSDMPHSILDAMGNAGLPRPESLGPSPLVLFWAWKPDDSIVPR
jgi:hypothetical protein